MTINRLTATAAVCTLTALASAGEQEPACKAQRYWPQWRGPNATGVAPHATPPLKWSDSRNIRWKRALPGSGHSTPIIWGDRIYLTAAVPYGDPLQPIYDSAPGTHDNLPVTSHHEFVVIAVNRRDGHIVWKRTVRKEIPHEGGHVTASLASNSPVTDGERVFAFFGSRGLYCLDTDGEVQWHADLGDMQTLHAHGEGGSPTLYGDTLIVNWDHQGDSFVIAYDKRTGKRRWKAPRDEPTSWATPLVVEHAGRAQLIISATNRVRSYDLATGQVIWQCAGLSRNVVASPVASDAMVWVASSYDHQAMLAINLEGAQGDITATKHIAWTRRQNTPYVPSPLLYGKRLYFLAHNHGILSCVTARTGSEIFGPVRLPAMRYLFASPLGAADRIYIADRSGTTLVIKHSDTFEILAQNLLDDSFSASPVAVDGELYLRGRQHLYCIAED